MSSEIFVKVAVVPGRTQEIALSEGASIADALDVAGVSVDSTQTIKYNGQTAGDDTIVSDGGRIIIAKGAKGA